MCHHARIKDHTPFFLYHVGTVHQHQECAEAQGDCFCQSHSRGLRGLLGGHVPPVKSLENIWACGAPIDICQQGQAATIKALVAQLNKVKSYASTIHGLNLILHRFCNKSIEDGEDCAASRVSWQLSGA